MSQNLKNMLSRNCGCNSGYGYYHNNNNNQLCKSLNENLNKQTNLSQSLKTDLLNFITNNHICIFNISEKNFDKVFLDDLKFIENNGDKIKNFYKKIFVKNSHNYYYYYEDYKKIQNSMSIHNVLRYWSENNALADNNEIQNLFCIIFKDQFKEKGSYYNDPCIKEDKYKNIIEFIVNHITQENLESFIISRWESFYQILIKKLKEKNFKFNQGVLYKALKYFDYAKEFIDYLLKNNLIIDSKCLEIVCEFGSYDALKYVLNYKIMPESIHFQKLFRSKKSEDTIVNRYYFNRNNNNNVDNDGFSTEGSGYTKEKFELLSAHGYKLTRDDLIKSIETKCEIPNIEKYGLNLDQEILELCDNKDFFPSYEFTCISKDMMTLRDMCTKKSKVSINNFIKKHNLIPDNICMKNACKLKGNKSCIELLVEKGGKLTDDCLKYACENIGSGYVQLKVIIDNYIENKNQKINMLENKLKKYEETFGKMEDKDKVEPNDNKEEIKNLDKQPDLISISDSDEAQNEINNIEDTNIVNIITISDELLEKIPAQKRRNLKIPKLYAEYFKDKNNRFVSFITLRKELLQKMKEEGWIDQNNKQLINIPKNLSEKLGIKEGQLKFDDIDKFVGLFYN